MTDTLTLYTHPMSRGRVARWMLEETGLQYETVLLEYGTTMKASEYLAINPMGKVPALRHGDAVVTENSAIALYLGDLAPDKQLAPAPGSAERAAYYRWISFMGPLEELMMAKQTGKLADPMTAGYGTEADVVSTLEHAIGGRDFLAGDCFTMADLLVSAYIGWYLQFKLLEPRENFIRFVELHRQRPAGLRAGALDDALMPKPVS
ncbi:glutathione S-transferase family protein [Thermomonas sp. HDW16]|uniref:glutathione S-transferase family protein n=1 Tax=Thermomonas sp. HDW16 TaxID=2714945 RepID=UPI001409A913|nr:glutathione S-transferase family protein [Thermomonas sp. HDW16]QIL20369.1 glutathione S-transferase family protein [Thermomonas sp. HDW16]